MPTHQPSREKKSAFKQAIGEARDSTHQPEPGAPRLAFPNVSARWLLAAGGAVVVGALACGWLTLCLLYWQGNWQLLYHPSPTITRTPATAGLSYTTVHFAATETGTTQLTGWWIPKAESGAGAALTILYLHGAEGNLSDAVDTLAQLHQQPANLFAIDYRGYGQSQPSRPSERQLRQDAEWSLTYLTLTRHIAAKNIVIYGSELGADIGLELAADHGELAGVILEQPVADPLAPLLKDSRSRLVPARALVADTYDLTRPATSLSIPSLWLIPQPAIGVPGVLPQIYGEVEIRKSAVFLNVPIALDAHYDAEMRRWLDDLN